MDKISTMLWYDKTAMEAAEFYVSLIPDSKIERVMYSPADNPSTPKGEVIVVQFMLAGARYSAINGGPAFKLSEAVSICIDCADQAEVDHYWTALTANGGAESACGWCKDRFGLSWQVVPRRLMELMYDPDAARAERAMQAMMTMGKIDIAALEAAAA